MTREPIVAHILMPINQYCKDYCSSEATVMPWLHDNLLMPDLNQVVFCMLVSTVLLWLCSKCSAPHSKSVPPVSKSS